MLLFIGGKTKDELSEVIKTLTDIESNLTTNRDSFKEIHDQINVLEKYLVQDHLKDVIEFAGKLPYRFDGLFKQVSLYRTKAQRQHGWKSFESDITLFGMELEVNNRHLKMMINLTKSGKFCEAVVVSF